MRERNRKEVASLNSRIEELESKVKELNDNLNEKEKETKELKRRFVRCL